MKWNGYDWNSYCTCGHRCQWHSFAWGQLGSCITCICDKFKLDNLKYLEKIYLQKGLR